MDNFSATWKDWNNDPDEAVKNVLPISFVYSPLKGTVPRYQMKPIECGNCRAVVCETNYERGFFGCFFCGERVRADARFLKDQELNEIEYWKAGSKMSSYVVLAVDCTAGDLEELKQVMLQSLACLQREVFVALVVFFHHIYVYDFSSDHPRCICINGEKGYKTIELLNLLKIQQEIPHTFLKYFSLSSSFSLINAVESLESKVFRNRGMREARCTGSALALSSALLKLPGLTKPGKIVLITSGACTVGPGKIVGLDLNEHIRTFRDIQNNKAPYLKKAIEFYDEFAADLKKSGYSVDVFCCSIDQAGLYELENICQLTGGYMFLYDCYKSPDFKTNFQHFFTSYIIPNTHSSLTIHCSPSIEICGCISQGYSFNNQSKLSSSSTQVGLSSTNIWGINTLDPNTSFTIFFHPKQKSSNPITIQFQTSYLDPDGNYNTRVSIHKFPNTQSALSGFDPETAIVITGKLAVWRLKTEEFTSIAKWVDNSLLKFTKRFAVVQDKTVRIPEEVSMFPQFVYFLRRSQFLNSFNVSPDESAFYRQFLIRFGVYECLLMIQPVLLSYSFECDRPVAQFLAVESMRKDRILLLDSFFNVVLWYGESICAWKEAGYDQSEEYEDFRKLLEMPEEDSQQIVKSRFPVPRVIKCKPRSVSERFIKARLDTKGLDSNSEIFSELMSIEAFIEKLKSLVLS